MDQATIDTLAALLSDLDQAGVVVVPDADTLRYRPRLALTADLAARLKTHKAALLAVLGHPRAVDGGQDQQDHGLDFDDLVEPGEPCPQCGSLAKWWDIGGNEHCQTCEPAGLSRSMGLAAKATRLRETRRKPS